MNAQFSLAKTRRFVLAGARVLASHLPASTAALDRDGFAWTDILIDEGRIAEIGPAGAGQWGDAPRASLAGRRRPIEGLSILALCKKENRCVSP